MAFHKQTVRGIELEGKTVLMRADYNVPLKSDGSIADDYRLRQSLPTLEYLLDHNCTVVICSHLGRPAGKPDKKLSLEPIAQHLANLLHKPVHFVPECIGDRVKQTIKNIHKPAILLLENLRFHAEEEQNNADFARQLATDSLAHYFIQDGFGVVHRAHASTDRITQFLPSVAGLLLEKEVTLLESVRDNPKRPLAVVLGGAKVSDKIKVVEHFAKTADTVVIGGAMANNFFAWQGYNIGKSKLEPGQQAVIERVARLVCSDLHDHRMCLHNNQKIYLPSDVATAKVVGETARRVNKPVDQLAEDDLILDMGDQSIEHMLARLEGAKTVLWSGTLGVSELPNFAHGSARLCLWLAQHKTEVTSVVGGGDTADFVLHWDAAHGQSFSHISTGGSACLELLAGQELPGVAALLSR
ncbi:MAG TPA: phosphoglycerate kinase [Candidatus Saccharimonadales bacterium]